MLVTVTLMGTSSLGRKGSKCLLDQLWFRNLAGFRPNKAAFNDFQSSHHHAFAYIPWSAGSISTLGDLSCSLCASMLLPSVT